METEKYFYVISTRIFAISIFLLLTFDRVDGYLKYTEQSCIDLVPRKDPNDADLPYGLRTRFSTGKRKRSDHYDEVPFKLTATERRYRRNSDLVVRVEGGYFEGLLIQARVVAGTGELLRGGVGLIGQFRYLPFLLTYLPCYDIPFASVIDKGKPVKLGNISLIWSSPDQEAGDIRFIASVLRGIHYWIIVSDILAFNPFPISTYSCGSILACYRICSYGTYPCSARDALFVFSYTIDSLEKREIQFTIGGKLPNNNSFLGVAFGDDYANLAHADLTVCYLERGRVKVEHLLIESIHSPPYPHNDIIELDDYDIHENMLWCRFRRPLIVGTTIDPRQSLFHFYFVGTIDTYYQRFMFPKRNDIYSSAFRRNFTAPINEIVSVGERKTPNSKFLLIPIIHFTILWYNY